MRIFQIHNRFQTIVQMFEMISDNNNYSNQRGRRFISHCFPIHNRNPIGVSRQVGTDYGKALALDSKSLFGVSRQVGTDYGKALALHSIILLDMKQTLLISRNNYKTMFATVKGIVSA